MHFLKIPEYQRSGNSQIGIAEFDESDHLFSADSSLTKVEDCESPLSHHINQMQGIDTPTANAHKARTLITS
jgi:hypothetical protein